MTLDEKLDMFYDSAIKEATAKNIQIIEEYKNSLKQIYDDHKASALQKAQLTLQLETEKLISGKNKTLSAETITIRKNTTIKTTELKEILFKDITMKLDEFMKTEAYNSVLVKQICTIKEFAKDEAVTIYINPSDADKKSLLENETNTELTVSATDFFGGTRAVIHAKNILIDNSFMTKLAEEKKRLNYKGGCSKMQITGKIFGINGPIIYLEGNTGFKMSEMVYVGKSRLVGEVIALTKNRTTIQVYEETTGLKPGEEVYSTNSAISVELAPGILSNIFDGVERPLNVIAEQSGAFIPRGVSVPSLDLVKLWDVHVTVAVGDVISGGTIIAEVPETTAILHKSMVPPNVNGTVTKVATDGQYTIKDTIVTIMNKDGKEQELSLSQKWPIRIPRPIVKRYACDKPLLTGQRILDSLFPIAKGGTATIPGGFGTGKTMTQHQLAKWSDADIIIYIGCGERGNEMTNVLEEFSELVDPKSGNLLLARTSLIANTSNMPVAAREASIYTGITLAEYYRDMGYHVAIMADSTSRWAEALRELSGRLEEMPAEEGFPAYLASRLSTFYERAGYMKNLNGTEGSVTIIGAVSPQGGDFSEPVTQNTKRFVRCFLALDKSLAYSRHFPAIHWLTSYSEYMPDLANWYTENVGADFLSIRNQILSLLTQENSLNEIVKLIGSDVLPDDQKLVLEISRIIRLGFLQQNAFHPEDTYVPMDKQLKMMETILYLYDKAKKLVAMNMPMSLIRESDIFDKLVSIKYDVANKDLYKFDEYQKMIDDFYNNMMASNA